VATELSRPSHLHWCPYYAQEIHAGCFPQKSQLSPFLSSISFCKFYFQIGRAKEGKRKRVENKEDISRQKRKCERGSER
jgi:hypothetical protein